MDEKQGRDLLAIGRVQFNTKQRTLTCSGATRHLSATESLLLETLVHAKGMVVQKEELKLKVWGNMKVSDNALVRKIFEVRSALRDITDSVTLNSVYGVGVNLVVGADGGEAHGKPTVR